MTNYQKRHRGKRLRRSLPAVLLLTACQAAPPQSEQRPEAEPATARKAPPLTEGVEYRVDPEASEVRVLVYRAGPLARFGHNHVIVGPLEGRIVAGDGAARSSFRLELAADELRVDPPAARAHEGDKFASEVSDEALQGTRENMLGEQLLAASRYPRVVIESVALEGPRWNPDVEANVTLHGTTRTVTFPAAVFQEEDTLTVIAKLSLTLSEFGIEPFTALGGGLKVQDQVDLRVRVVAARPG